MAIALNWQPTEAEDAKGRQMREAGATWAEVGAALGVSRHTVTYWARKAGWWKAGVFGPKPGIAIGHIDMYREPLPAGHPVSWGAIVAGTCLETVEYGS